MFLQCSLPTLHLRQPAAPGVVGGKANKTAEEVKCVSAVKISVHGALRCTVLPVHTSLSSSLLSPSFLPPFSLLSPSFLPPFSPHFPDDFL